MRALLFAVAILLLFGTSANAQQTARRTAGGTGYLEYLPPDYYTNPTKKYPLIIFLHGLGERGDGSPASLELVKKNGTPYEIKRGNNMCFTVDGKEECFIVISPQLPTSQGSWYQNIIDEVFNHAYANYRYDPQRVYLTGLSLGGNGTYRYAGSSYNVPNELAAIAPVAGWDGGSDPCIIADAEISMWGFHGDKDPTIPYSSGLSSYNRVVNCNPSNSADFLWTSYPGVGHNSWWMTYLTDHSWHDPNLYEWFLKHTKPGSAAPVANAGADKSITLPTNSIVLNGSGSDADGSIISYSWIKLSGPGATLANENTNNLTVTGMVAGTYTFRLTVKDNDGQTDTDDVKVIVQPAPPNASPVANAGTDITITLPQSTATITGSGNDSDGSISSYSWSQVSGPSSATLSGNTTPNLTASGLIEGKYVLRLTVTDNKGATDIDDVQITVNAAIVNDPPVANAGSDLSIKLPVSSTNISGSASDPDGTVVSYKWVQVSGPTTATLANTTNPTLSASSLSEGVYVFELTVTDNSGDSDTDQVKVTVEKANSNPVANAGSDQSINLPTSTAVMNGSGSDGDGSITSYLWTQISGPSAATLANKTTANLTASGLIEGKYVFRLEVTDNEGASATDDVQITVVAPTVNQVPVAVAGPDKSITLPSNSVTLIGSGTDSDGNINGYAWSKVSGPGGVTIVSPGQAQTDITNLVAGTYVFRLQVSDNQGATDTDDVKVTVSPATVNTPPLVNAGPDKQITLPASTIMLNGSATDADGSITSTTWKQISGPVTATLSGASTLVLNVSGLVEGTFVFELSAIDNKGASTNDQVTVKINAANVGPTVNAGSDINLLLPENTVAIKANATDPDGTIADILWTQVAGPNTGTLAGAATQNVTISGLIEGTYTFRITVSDNDGASAQDEVNINVSAANILPVVTAGSDKTITLPTNTITLIGNATDGDGTISTYVWTQVSGPSTATLTNKTTKNLTATGLVEGTYKFKLTATDNDSGASSAEVTVTVLPEIINSAPVANAGVDITMTLPVNSTNIMGSGSDSDGSIDTYLWKKVSGGAVTVTNPGNATVSLKDLEEGIYVFELTVTDNKGATGKDQVKVTVNPADVNSPPVANAGNDVTLILPNNTTTLSGSGSDNDGSVLTYLWSKVSGGTATLNAQTTPSLLLQDLEEGTYQFKLTVTDEDGATDEDLAIVTVLPITSNNTPVANAGADKTLQLPTNSTTISGSASDNDGEIITYAWSKVSGPSAAILANSDKAQVTVSGLVEGTYTFRLTVTDNEGASATDNMTVTVLAAALNTSPIANAGNDVTINLPTNEVSLYGTGSDANGAVIKYQWLYVSGPASYSMDTPGKSSTLVKGLAEGKYVFRLTVTDNEGATGSDNIRVTVNPASANIAPIVSAGVDKTIFLPINKTFLEGSAFDPDGEVEQYQWIKVSGGNATLKNADSPTLDLENLEQGTYVFRLTVKDNAGTAALDQATLYVQPSTVNQPPVVDAGPDVNLVLPDNSVTIQGKASDASGLVSVEWISVAGTPGSMQTNQLDLILSDLTEGFYSFQLTATDDEGLSTSDMVNVQVSPDEKIPPIILMMPDLVIVQPDGPVDLWAEAFDDGEVVSVVWEQLLGQQLVMTEPQKNINPVSDWLPGTYEFRITVTDDDGLTSRESVVVTIMAEGGSEPAFPMKVITPNGDYDNERWILDPDIQLHANCTLVIFNRQGQEVYRKLGYANDWTATLNGKALPEGVYYYVLQCGDHIDGTLTGSITVIR